MIAVKNIKYQYSKKIITKKERIVLVGHIANKLQQYNRWQRRICTLSYVTIINSFSLIIVIIKCLSYSEITATLCALFSGKHVNYNRKKNFIFATCDVMYNWSISLLRPIVLDNLFGLKYICRIDVQVQRYRRILVNGRMLTHYSRL